MGSLDDNSSLGVPGFGDLPDSRAVEIMRVVRKHDVLVFEGEVTALYMEQHKAEEWTDARSKRTRTVRFPRLAVRIASSNGAIEPGQELVVAGYPLSRRWVNAEKFKPPCKRSAGEKGRAPRPEASDRPFESEGEVLDWIEKLPHDYWETGNYLTAGILRPGVAPRARNVAKGRKHFGVCQQDASRVVEELLQSDAAKMLVAQARAGQLIFQHPEALRQGQLATLSPELRDTADSWMAEAIIRALAGPTSTESAAWLERPVMEFADALFRHLLNEENRRLWKKQSGESSFEEE